jgi:tetratricopeptide (TPR) repeat protein
VNSRLNRFASAGLLVLLAGCHSVPTQSAHTAASTPSPVPAPASAGRAVPNPSGSNAALRGGAATGNAAAVGGAPAPDTTPIPPRAAQQYSQALQLMKSNRHTDAELEFKQLTVAYPQFAGPQLNLGLLYLHDSRLPEAEAAFKAALQVTPANPIAGDELGIVERKLGKFTDAEAAYLRSIAAEPNYAPAHLNLGVLYDLYLSEPQKALEQFERYIEIAGENKQVAGWVIELRKRVGVPAAAAKKEDPA